MLPIFAILVALAAPPPAPTNPLPDRNPAIDPDSWTRYAHGAAAIGGTVYLAGGAPTSGGHEFHTRVDALNLKARTWSTVAELPTPRAFPAVVALGDRLYVVGGLEQPEGQKPRDSAVAERFDPAANRWEALAPLPTPRSRLAGVAAGGCLYIIGGMTERDGVHADSALVEKFDPKTGAWSRCADLPTPRHALAAAAVNGRIYALGGYSAEVARGAHRTVEVYDPDANAWSAAPEMLAPRAWFCAAALEGRVYVFGDGGSGAPGGPERFDPSAGSWQHIAIADVPGRRAAPAASGDAIYILGGEGRGDEFLRVFRPADVPTSKPGAP